MSSRVLFDTFGMYVVPREKVQARREAGLFRLIGYGGDVIYCRFSIWLGTPDELQRMWKIRLFLH